MNHRVAILAALLPIASFFGYQRYPHLAIEASNILRATLA